MLMVEVVVGLVMLRAVRLWVGVSMLLLVVKLMLLKVAGKYHSLSPRGRSPFRLQSRGNEE